MRINVFLAREHQKPGNSAAATLLLIRFIFHNFNLAKIISEVCEWNIISLKSTMHLKQVQVEGIRSKHVFWDGKFYDLYEFALTREGYEEMVQSKLWRQLIGS